MNGYTQKRRGAVEHLRDGRFTLLEYGAHDLILALADKANGIWWGSAKALVATCGAGDITDRQARHLLESLEKKGYLKRFPRRRGHGNYPILVNKFEVTFGAYKGMRLNAANTTDWRNPVYEPCQEQGPEQGEARAPFREGDLRNKKEKEKRTAAKTAPPADPRFQPFVDFAYKAFEQKHRQRPTWGVKDFKFLSAVLSSNKGLSVSQLQGRFRNYLNSTEGFTQKQGDSLSYFCAHVDSFLAGPILERRKPNGNYSGKVSNVETTLAGYQRIKARAD
jgi:hypothetical protein